MKSIKLFFTALITFSCLSVAAQDKAEKPEKKEKIKVEKPYMVHDRSSKVNRVDIRKDLKGVENVIQIDATNASGGANLASTDKSLATAAISSVNVISGNYNQTRELAKTARGMSMQLLDVVFPCRIRVNISDQYADIEIKEPGFWKISLGITN